MCVLSVRKLKKFYGIYWSEKCITRGKYETLNKFRMMSWGENFETMKVNFEEHHLRKHWNNQRRLSKCRRLSLELTLKQWTAKICTIFNFRVKSKKQTISTSQVFLLYDDFLTYDILSKCNFIFVCVSLSPKYEF